MLKPNRVNDFGYDGYGTFYYWTPQDWVPHKYAQFTYDVIYNKVDGVILRMVTPENMTRPAGKTREMDYGEEWRKPVFFSWRLEDVPDDWIEKFRKTEVFRGPVSIYAIHSFKGMKTWKDLTASSPSSNACTEFC